MYSQSLIALLCLSFSLYSAPVRSHPGHERYHHVQHHAPRDFRDSGYLQKRQLASSAVLATGFLNSTSTASNYTWLNEWRSQGATAGSAASLTAAPVSAATAQGVPFTTTVELYQVYDPAATSYSTIYRTSATSSCSTVLTGFFTQITVSECDQSVTFSTKSSFQLTTTMGPVTTSRALAARQEDQTPTTYVQSIVSYYIAPWQSVAASTPTGITVLVCVFSITGVETCNPVSEVWVVHTEVVPVVSSTTLSISTHFPSAAHLVIGNGQTLSVPAGDVNLETVVVYSTSTVSLTTSASRLPISSAAASSDPGLSTRTTTIRTSRTHTETITVANATPHVTAFGILSNVTNLSAPYSNATIRSGFYLNTTTISTATLD